jgi:hypothetical protein
MARRQKYYTYTPRIPIKPFKLHSVKKSAISYAIFQTKKGKPTTVWRASDFKKGIDPKLLWQPVQMAIGATSALSVMSVARGAMGLVK